MQQYYSEENIKKYGVLAIKIKVIWCKSYYFYLNVIK
jgi:ASC-1-like (ASCH) protein